MSSRRQRSIPLGGRYRQVSLYPVNSIRHKFPTVDYILQNGYIDIFDTCETKLDNSFPKHNFMLKIVYIIAKTAQQAVGWGGGGVGGVGGWGGGGGVGVGGY